MRDIIDSTLKLSHIAIGAVFIIGLLYLMIPANAFAKNEPIIQPSSDGVSNPAAGIELVDPAADANFTIYVYEGTDQLSFDSEDYPYYENLHTVTVRLIGEDPTRECDDNIAFFSGNNDLIETKSQEKTGGSIRTAVLGQNEGESGTSMYTVMTSSGQRLQFKVNALWIPHSLRLKFDKLFIKTGGIGRQTAYPGDVTWTSSDASIATVSSRGIISGVSEGKAVITATYTRYGLHMTASCDVTVGTPVIKGRTYTAGSSTAKATYKVTDTSKRTVVYTACRAAGSKALIPDCITLSDGEAYYVTGIRSGAFAKAKKIKTVTVSCQSLTKAGVKNCLKGSAVKTVRLSKYRAYKSYFTKKNCGRKVTIKRL